MKTLHLSIIMLVITGVIFLTLFQTSFGQYGPGFYPVEHYPPTNDTKLKLIVMNSTDFKIRTTGYNYTLAGIDYNWIAKSNNYYDFGGARVTFLVWGFGNATTKGEAFNLDSQMRIKSIFEYNADNPPPGYYTDRCMGDCPAEISNTKPQCCGPPYVPKTLDTPLKQFKSGIKAEDIQCKEGIQLVIKSEYGSPACVKPQTAQKLIERGWAMDETAHPEGSSHYMTSTNSTIIPGHMPRNSCSVMLPYYYSSGIINYSGYVGVYPSPFMYWGKQDDFVLMPGNTGTITYEINASLSHGEPTITPFAVPKFLDMTNYAIFYHEVTSLAELTKYPGVTINDHHDFKACLVRPTGERLCIGGDQNGNDTIEAYVVDHPGIHALFEPPSEVLQPSALKTQSSKLITMVITADKDAPRGTYLVVLSPECGGVTFLLTVGEKPYQE